ncbi:MAG TPA: DinB family protein [Acidimicrobiales bacterium]|nr:DinB family protein [Acidimicrobiales bacterium]
MRDDDAERTSLVEWLGGQREHVLGILEGLDDVQLRRAMLPSGWSFLGMVQHLAFDVEHYWFRCIVGGESLDFFGTEPEEKQDFWEVAAEADAQQLLAAYRDEIGRSNAVIAATPLDQAPAQRDEWWGDWDVPDLRVVLLHVIAETACHAGHLDAARELLDGRKWLSLT